MDGADGHQGLTAVIASAGLKRQVEGAPQAQDKTCRKAIRQTGRAR
jgi:hypothetical protein